MMVMARSLVLGFSLVVAAIAAPRPAAACGMYRMPILKMQPPRAEELLVEAGKKIQADQWAAASRLADQVQRAVGPRDEQKAAALAIVGWAAWQAGARARALAAFRRARALDKEGKATDEVLARAKVADKLHALRASLKA
jgi:hypothetical protein